MRPFSKIIFYHFTFFRSNINVNAAVFKPNFGGAKDFTPMGNQNMSQGGQSSTSSSNFNIGAGSFNPSAGAFNIGQGQPPPVGGAPQMP